MGWAVTGPQMHVPVGLAHRKVTQVLIRDEQNRPFLIHGLHYLDCIGRGAADIRTRLDRCGGIHIADHLNPRIFDLFLLQLFSSDHVGHGAASFLVWK